MAIDRPDGMDHMFCRKAISASDHRLANRELIRGYCVPRIFLHAARSSGPAARWMAPSKSSQQPPVTDRGDALSLRSLGLLAFFPPRTPLDSTTPRVVVCETSTPPPPSRVLLAALTMASTAKVVISAWIISMCIRKNDTPEIAPCTKQERGCESKLRYFE